ncbi:exonuclease-like protein [Ostreococcus tauri]|uniref:RNA exonuclease 4 n=1 Tax=Ostreococcus tauri TaxID=70448 RepID=A0A1Y5I1Y4_OSTTA|nr:exonuclease-like protein [Ostreococcus tauri]
MGVGRWFVVWRLRLELLVFLCRFVIVRTLGRWVPSLKRLFSSLFPDVRVSCAPTEVAKGRRGASGSSRVEQCHVDGGVELERGRSGVGVWYAYGHRLNYAASASGRSMDNNAVEMCAVYAALSRHDGEAPLELRSDSRWVCKALERLTSGNVVGMRVNAVTIGAAFVLSQRTGGTIIQKVRAHVGGNHTDNARADQLAAVGMRSTEEPSFVPDASDKDGFFHLVRALWRADVVRALTERFIVRSPATGNGCIDGTGSSEERRKAHTDVSRNVKKMDGVKELVRPKPLNNDFSITDVLALDCEMVGVGDGGLESILAQVCVLNEHGNTVYTSYSRAYRAVTDYRTQVSGISQRHVDESAPEFHKVRRTVAELIKGRVVVGHALENDFKALQLHHPREDVRDTAVWRPLLRPPRFLKPRRLRHLARDFVSLKIQCGDSHDPAEDALAALYIYRRFKDEWEGQIAASKQGKRKPQRDV